MLSFTVLLAFPKVDTGKEACRRKHHRLLLRWSVGAAMAKCHELAGFNNRRGFLTGLTSGKSKVKALAEVLSGRDTLPDLHMATFWLCAHTAETERAQVSFFSYKGTGPILGASPEPAYLSELPK